MHTNATQAAEGLKQNLADAWRAAQAAGITPDAFRRILLETAQARAFADSAAVGSLIERRIEGAWLILQHTMDLPDFVDRVQEALQIVQLREQCRQSIAGQRAA
ncbi:hypothetical protein [Rhodomicrobium lacus]|uniref:hypothetical protein n=1 Tax=Rhodomicrobium lacus TaxID=2498452 RepID=UPI000F8DFF61|nr:hypothetical protein [Rhodomicrobium lacus]